MIEGNEKRELAIHEDCVMHWLEARVQWVEDGMQDVDRLWWVEDESVPVEMLGGLDFLPKVGKRHDKSGEEEEGASNGTSAGSGEEKGRWWSRHVMGWDHTHCSWCEREEEDGKKRWWEAHRTSGVHLREGAQGKYGPWGEKEEHRDSMSRVWVGGWRGKERRKHSADGELKLEAFQSQSRVHARPKIIICRHR